MSIYKYFQSTVKLRDPEGPLRREICSSTIQTVNDKVRSKVEKKVCGSTKPYLKQTRLQKRLIGERAAEHGVTATIHYFSQRFQDIETTVRRLKDNYTTELRKYKYSEHSEVIE